MTNESAAARAERWGWFLNFVRAQKDLTDRDRMFGWMSPDVIRQVRRDGGRPIMLTCAAPQSMGRRGFLLTPSPVETNDNGFPRLESLSECFSDPDLDGIIDFAEEEGMSFYTSLMLDLDGSIQGIASTERGAW